MSSFRTVAPFLRTARTSLRSAHPLVSLQRQSTSPVLNLRRGYAVYERTKPHVNIGSCDPQLHYMQTRGLQNMKQEPLVTSITER